MPATRTWLKNPLAIFTANALDARGGLVLQDGLIVEVLSAGQQPSAPCDHVFDAREHVILPGLINTHHHFYQTLTRAWAPVVNQPLFPWLKTLYPVWARLTPENSPSPPKSRWPSCSCPVVPPRPITITCFRKAWKMRSTYRSRVFASWACAPCSLAAP